MAKVIKFDKKLFYSAVVKSSSARKAIKQESQKELEKKVKEAKKELLSDFDNHKITQEIKLGPKNKKNISNTLIGLPEDLHDGGGSLFGFIGFLSADKPIDGLRNYLNQTGKVFKTTTTEVSSRGVRLVFKVNTPNKERIEKDTPMPWENGRSWVRGIERGISGLGSYLANESKKSRSGQGVQATNTLRAAFYRPTSYMSKLINDFVKSVEKAAR